MDLLGGSGQTERGASAVTVALMLTALGGFLALVLNVGHFMVVRGQLQNACDSAALASALELDGTLDGLERARAKAVDFAGRHQTDRGATVLIDREADVVFGNWDWDLPKESAFTPVSESEPGAERQINAVLVRAGREQTRGNPLEVFFPVFLGGREEASVTAEACAVGGAPCDGCSVPLAFARCQIEGENGALQCGQTLLFRSDTMDNIGFTNLTNDDRSVSTSGIIDILHNKCGSVKKGDHIGVGNGNNLNPNVVRAFEDFIYAYGDTVSAPIVETRDGCPAKFEGLLNVIGFAKFRIVGVVGPPNQSIEIELLCTQVDDEDSRPGCDYFGMTSPRSVLVR
jgi:Flp pilus assembly protein TadG